MMMVSSPLYTSEIYWAEFEVTDEDLDFIYNLLLDREVPLTTDEMTGALVDHRLEKLKQEAARAVETALPMYLPGETYEVGQKLVFPAFENRVAEIVGLRPGKNQDLGPFDVIQVVFEDSGEKRDFAARLENHLLNQPPEPSSDAAGMDTQESIVQRYGSQVNLRLAERLDRADDIVRIAGRWFPKALLADIHEGHLNLAEAVLDVAGGGPLPTASLLEHVETPGGLDPLLAEFSLDFALQEDERFDEVGPAGHVLWYLKRLEPPEVLYTPQRLEYRPVPYDRSNLTELLLELEKELDDELSSVEEAPEDDDEVTISLLFPHWRVGTLPLSSRLKKLFPTAYESPRIRFILVDGHTGDEFPGWVVRNEGYVYGLDEWYKRNAIPAGGLIKVRRGEKQGEVIVEAVDLRHRNDWIRTVTVSEASQIGFTMLKYPVGTAYDDLMVVGLLDMQTLDEAWLQSPQRRMPLDRLVANVFRELAKLNPQSAVHAQALYSGINVIRRLPPGPVFAELVNRPWYVHVGDLYWRFDDALWSQS